MIANRTIGDTPVVTSRYSELLQCRECCTECVIMNEYDCPHLNVNYSEIRKMYESMNKTWTQHMNDV